MAELLHSLSQPLTSLQCSLELSLERFLEYSLAPSSDPSAGNSWGLTLEKVVEHQYESAAVALQQTEQVIGMIQLMREYTDAERPEAEAFSDLDSAIRSVTGELSLIAAVRAVEVHIIGACASTLPVSESRLRLALQYLIAALIEAQPASGRVTLLFGEDPGRTVLRGKGEPGFRGSSGPAATLRRVRLTIATRVLESAGASLVLGDIYSAGFVLCIPRGAGEPAACL